MKRYFWISMIICAAACLQSCEKDTMVYGGEPGGVSGIYFLYSSGYTMMGGVKAYNYQDSMEISFAKVPGNVTKNTVYLPVNVLGNVADYDRTYRVKVVSDVAVEGVDYEPLHEEYVVPANASAVQLPLVLLRTERLKKEKLRLTVELLENEDFKLLLPSKLGKDQKTEVSTTHLKVIFSEIYTKPFYWVFYGQEVFGDFTLAKFEFVNAQMGWAPADWDNGGVSAGIIYYAGRKVQQALQLRADAGDPVLDEDGKPMQLGDGYEVDYSKYE